MRNGLRNMFAASRRFRTMTRLRRSACVLVKSPSSQPYTAGIVIDREERQSLRLGALRTDSPAERAGLQQGDVLVSIGGTTVARDNWLSVLNRYKRGERVPVIDPPIPAPVGSHD